MDFPPCPSRRHQLLGHKKAWSLDEQRKFHAEEEREKILSWYFETHVPESQAGMSYAELSIDNLQDAAWIGKAAHLKAVEAFMEAKFLESSSNQKRQAEFLSTLDGIFR